MYIFAQAESVSEGVATTVNDVAAAAGAVGGFVALTVTTLLIFALAWFVLQVIADWMIFSKAGQPGWKSIIPIYNVYVEYEICWSGIYGLLFMVISIVSSILSSGTDVPTWKIVVATIISIIGLVIHFIQSVKLSKSFGKGVGFGIILFLFGPIGRMILAFGRSTYVGKE